MEKKYELMIDPTPRGWMYGFPKALPESAIHGKGSDLFVRKNFDLIEWLVNEGYPEELIGYWKLYPQEKVSKEYVKVGEWPQELPKEYYYPGNDPQE